MDARSRLLVPILVAALAAGPAVGCGSGRSPALDGSPLPSADSSTTSDGSAGRDVGGPTDDGGGEVECRDAAPGDFCVCGAWDFMSGALTSDCDEGSYAPARAICCAEPGFPSSGSCQCTAWGCDAPDTSSGASCTCGRGGTLPSMGFSSCVPSSSEFVCCATVSGSCFCARGVASAVCGTAAVVPRCDVDTIACGSGVPRTVRRVSCEG